LQPPALKVGNLEARRDFTDVRDIVRAYLMALERGKPGDVYNIGSGKAPRLREILELLLKQARMKVRLEVDATRKRAAEAPVYLCDARRFQRLTGWRPQISLERMLRDTLAYWRGIERGVA
jgi:GDP-4-dehydro-6-deoxy-D-mannose reductase